MLMAIKLLTQLSLSWFWFYFSDDQAMDQFAMKHFCDTKLGEYTLPSQRRY